MAEHTYESLPQRGSGRGKRASAGKEQDAQRCGLDASQPQAEPIGSPIDTPDVPENAGSSAPVPSRLYRTDAEGDACYECELRY